MRGATLAAACVLANLAAAADFNGRWFSGSGAGDAVEWLEALDTARSQFSPNPLLQSIDMLYTTAWNGLVEGPTWSAWWTQNSYGVTFASLPFLPEPLRTFVRNANWMWFEWIGNGTRVGLDDPNPAPDGCLCDAAQPSGAYYKQGDGNVPIHDWALEETLSAIVMQAEQCLQERDVVSINGTYLPLFTRTMRLLESRLDPATGLFLIGDAANLLAPSAGAWLLPNGTRAPAWLTGVSVSYAAAMDRVVELRRLVGDDAGAARDAAKRDAAIAALPQLLAPSGDYFVKWADPDGPPHTLHGVLGQAAHGYIEAVVNHDAVAFGVADRVRSGLSEAIMARLLGASVPVNPQTGGPGLRPFSLVITNAAGLDDMEYPASSSWLWQYGTWVNGGEWATCEGRMMLAYAATNRSAYALDSFRALMGFANTFRMDSPLVSWGSAPYQPSEPINTVVDMWAIPAALIRGLWGPVYSADSLTLTPALPGNITSIAQAFPLVWGAYGIFLSTTGAGPITAVTLDGVALPAAQWTATNVTLLWATLPPPPANLTLVLTLTQAPGRAAVPLSPHQAPAPPLRPYSSGLTRETSVRVLRGLAVLPATPIMWLDATTLAGTLPSGAAVAEWPDISGSGANASQPTAGLRPVFNSTGMGDGLPTVTFDGVSSFLAGTLALPGESTIVALLSNAATPPASDCCNGVFFSAGGCNGLSMKVAPPTSDDPSEGGRNATLLMIDWSGSGDGGVDDLTGRQALVASVMYNATGSYSWAGGCLQSSEPPSGAPGGPAFMVGSRNNEDARFFNGSLSELLVFGRALNESELGAVEAYLTTKWPPPRTQPPLQCFPLPNCTLSPALLAAQARLASFVPAMYAAGFAGTRYELAHAQLAQESLGAWQARCAGLHAGTVQPLADKASEKAADALYAATPAGLYAGLSAVIEAYAGSPDPARAEIYALWNAAAR